MEPVLHALGCDLRELHGYTPAGVLHAKLHRPRWACGARGTSTRRLQSTSHAMEAQS